MNDSEIIDKRVSKGFSGITFSGYKKSDAKKQLLNSLLNEKIEPACYWSVEFICAGHFLELWDIILNFYGKNIHMGNPKIPIYLSIRFNSFKDIVLNGYIKNEIKMRNNIKIRELFAEIISVLSLSNKKNELIAVKVAKTEFNIASISDKLKADNIIYGQGVFKKEDPKDIFIAVNEFAYCLLNKKNSRECFYWLEWLIEYESIYKKQHKTSLICATREFAPVETKLSKDFIWILWEIILLESKRQGEQIEKIIKSVFELFSIRYNNSCKRKRKFLLYSSILFITEITNLKIQIVNDEEKVKSVVKNINIIYKEVKKNEKRPNTDYLFNNSFTNNNNLENTIKKLDKMNNFKNLIIRN